MQLRMGRETRAAVVLWVAVLSVALACGTSFASTLTGATGLIQVPSASVLGVGEAEGGVRYVGERFALSGAFGAFENVEIAVNTLKTSASPVDLGIVFKGVVFPETAERPGVAVGFETGQSYVVASKRLTPRMAGHAGFGYGDLRGAFAGVAVALSAASTSGTRPATTVMAEYTPNGINVGARMVFSPLLSADLALIDLSEFAGGVSVRMEF